MREVKNSDWVKTHKELFDQGFVRFEYLTAAHISNDDFELFSKVATEDLSETQLTKCQITSKIDSLDSIYIVANFQERELAQMFGIKVIGKADLEKAFNTDFDGYPLRKDFALTTRQQTNWPGAVELDEKARRRSSLPPGVFETWDK